MHFEDTKYNGVQRSMYLPVALPFLSAIFRFVLVGPVEEVDRTT
jgi:hypothetical protein